MTPKFISLFQRSLHDIKCSRNKPKTLNSTLDSSWLNFFLVVLANLMDMLKKYFSHLKPGTDPFCVALFPAVIVADSLKMLVERSTALESRVLI